MIPIEDQCYDEEEAKNYVIPNESCPLQDKDDSKKKKKKKYKKIVSIFEDNEEDLLLNDKPHTSEE